MLHKEWDRLWQTIGARAYPPFGWIAGLYAEPHRRYHTMAHVAHCLAEFGRLRPLCAFPDVVTCAIFFHDVVYDTTASDNEWKSAELAGAVLEDAGVHVGFADRVRALILATAHGSPARDPSLDMKIMLDVDLAILGAGPAAFKRYDRDIREEYVWVPEDVYRAKRREVLQDFLDRGRIFLTDVMHERYEEDTRRNLAAAVLRLR